jgi:hypothetical protein
MNIFDKIRGNESILKNNKYNATQTEKINNTIDTYKQQLRAVLGEAKSNYRVHEMLDAISWEGIRYIREINHYLESYAMVSVDGITYHKIYLDINEFKYVTDNNDIYVIDNACVALTEILRKELLKLV